MHSWQHEKLYETIWWYISVYTYLPIQETQSRCFILFPLQTQSRCFILFFLCNSVGLAVISDILVFFLLFSIQVYWLRVHKKLGGGDGGTGQLGQLTPTEQRDIPDQIMSCSAIKPRGSFSKVAIAQGLVSHQSVWWVIAFVSLVFFSSFPPPFSY